MWFNLLMFAITGAICWFQTLQGAYSSLIMLVLTSLMTVVSFEFFEQVAPIFSFMPEYAYGSAFMAIFIAGMLGLRYLYDWFAPANMYFPTVIDRSLAGLFGFFTALIVTGIMAIGIQMFPLGPAVLGYDRIGIVGEPLEGEKYADRTRMDLIRIKTFAMDFTVDEAKALTRAMWLGQDDFAFGVYNMLLGGFRASDRSLPKDPYERDLTADEFLARCWDWRVQNRFQITPVGLRIPLWQPYIEKTGKDKPPVAPILLRDVWKMTGRSYGETMGAEPGLYKHVFAVIEIPRNAGVLDWYWRSAEKGGVHRGGDFPPMDRRVIEALKGDGAEFASFAYWQVRLIVVDQETKKKEELPVRGVFPLDVRRGLDAAGLPAKGGAKPVKFDVLPDVVTQIKNCRPDNVPAGNISLLRAPADEDEPWYFRVLFYARESQLKDKVYLEYTPVPRDTRDLADQDKRLRSVVRSDPVGVRDLDNQLLHIEPPPRHAWWRRVRPSSAPQ